jgi:acyl carrier protein
MFRYFIAHRVTGQTIKGGSKLDEKKHIEEKVRKFINHTFLRGREANPGLENDTSFLEKGIVDSTGVLELVTFLEETFNIKVEDEELVPENLDSVSNLVKFVSRKSDQGAVG